VLRPRIVTIENGAGAAPRQEAAMTSLWCRFGTALLGVTLAWLIAGAALAQTDDCKNRGQLDTLYCDDDRDLVADPPKDARAWKDPATIVIAYTPFEDPADNRNNFKPFNAWSITRCSRTRRRSRRCVPVAFMSPDSRPGRPASR
jgi:hypothetical protein